MLGHVLYRLGHYSAAIEVLDMALVDAGDDAARRGQILGDRALALGGARPSRGGDRRSRQALELAPDSAGLNHVLGFVLYFAGRPDRGDRPVQRALEIDPTFTAALRTLALAQAAAGKADDAVELLQRALRAEPARPRRRPAALHPAHRARRVRRSAGGLEPT